MAESLVLSRRRAENVRDLVVEAGVGEERVTVVFFGKSRPVRSNETESGRSANRRVELSFEYAGR
jgi:OOP family OmpA-OmpF porin